MTRPITHVLEMYGPACRPDLSFLNLHRLDRSTDLGRVGKLWGRVGREGLQGATLRRWDREQVEGLLDDTCLAPRKLGRAVLIFSRWHHYLTRFTRTRGRGNEGRRWQREASDVKRDSHMELKSSSLKPTNEANDDVGGYEEPKGENLLLLSLRD